MSLASVRSALFLLFAGAVLLAGSTAAGATAPTVPTFERTWGHPGAGNSQFNGPNGVAIDAVGNTYVVDHVNCRLQKFDACGRHLATWGSAGTGNGQFSLPTGVAVDAAGNVYVADYGNHRIQTFSATGTYLTQWGGLGAGNGQLNHPQSVAVDASGRVYVADTGNHRVQLFTGAGGFLAAWGTFGDGDVQFNAPNAVAVAGDGRIYVADYGNHRVEVFSAPGAYETEWGGYGGAPGQFANPSGVAVDALGFVYVVDRENHRLQKFTSTGVYVGQWGGYGTAEGLFAYPTHVAVDAAGNVVVSDFNNQRVQRFSGAGLAPAVPVPSFARAVGSLGSGLGQFASPMDLAFGSDGYLYVIEFGNSRVQVLDPAGVPVATLGSAGGAPGQFSWPWSLAVGSDGNLYVADYGNSRVQKLTTGGAPLATWGSIGSGIGQFQAPSGIAVSDDGFVYVGDRILNRIQKFTTAGAYVSQWGGSGQDNGQFSAVDGIAVGKDGFVYVADNTEWRLQKFSAAGAFLAAWSFIDGRSVHAGSVEIGPTGEILYTDISRQRVEMIDSEGTWLGGWGPSASGPTALAGPRGIAVDREGNCWVADTGNHRIVQFGIPPVITQVSDVKNDQGRQVRLRFLRAGQDAAGSAVPVLRYDIYRKIDADAGASPGKLAGWEQVGSVSARGDTEYNAVVPALVNATASSVQYSTFFVSAVTGTPTVYYDSPPACGYAIDNLSPPAPTAFAGAYAGGATRLRWAPSPAPDFAQFRLYRGAAAGFTPDAGHLVAALSDTGFVDPGEPGAWYRLCAVDFDGNVSLYAQLGPQQTSPVPDAGAFPLRLHQNEPNPFNPRTAIRFDLPRAGHVALRVYDLRGRVVRTLVDGALPAGARDVTWDGCDDRGQALASGCYMTKLVTADGTRSVRMTLLR